VLCSFVVSSEQHQIGPHKRPEGVQSASAYFGQMRALSDELAAAGKSLGEGELISFIVAGLDMEYQPIISALDVRTEPITIDALFSLVANFDQRVEMFHGNGAGGFKSSANAASRGRSGGGRGGYRNQNQKNGVPWRWRRWLRRWWQWLPWRWQRRLQQRWWLWWLLLEHRRRVPRWWWWWPLLSPEHVGRQQQLSTPPRQQQQGAQQ
uniref:Uncharacterized protein n=1 Tax=Aegilops tauschii subsp. strangulata TaxID=200361 RepID=A0A452YN09_AEGTS